MRALPGYVWDTIFLPTLPHVMATPRIQTEQTSAEVNLGYYVLPGENDIGALVLRNTTDNRASGGCADEVMARFEAKMRRKSGVELKVKEALGRPCKTMKEGWF
ncbi:hypothetical protein BS47DRAFT_1354141, partial [Hydnum rufescens UP504]